MKILLDFSKRFWYAKRHSPELHQARPGTRAGFLLGAMIAVAITGGLHPQSVGTPLQQASPATLGDQNDGGFPSPRRRALVISLILPLITSLSALLFFSRLHIFQALLPRPIVFVLLFTMSGASRRPNLAFALCAEDIAQGSSSVRLAWLQCTR
jgi:hypothetical protein